MGGATGKRSEIERGFLLNSDEKMQPTGNITRSEKTFVILTTLASFLHFGNKLLRTMKACY